MFSPKFATATSYAIAAEATIAVAEAGLEEMATFSEAETEIEEALEVPAQSEEAPPPRVLFFREVIKALEASEFHPKYAEQWERSTPILQVSSQFTDVVGWEHVRLIPIFGNDLNRHPF